jgi:hypothetical protein
MVFAPKIHTILAHTKNEWKRKSIWRLGQIWVKKFRPSKPRGDKIELFLAKNKEKVLKT